MTGIDKKRWELRRLKQEEKLIATATQLALAIGAIVLMAIALWRW